MLALLGKAQSAKLEIEFSQNKNQIKIKDTSSKNGMLVDFFIIPTLLNF